MTLIITTKINQTQIDMTDENLDLKALITEAASAAVANVVAPMQAEIKALKKQITPEALTDAEMTAKRKEFRAAGSMARSSRRRVLRRVNKPLRVLRLWQRKNILS